jgi:hypothetical protein
MQSLSQGGELFAMNHNPGTPMFRGAALVRVVLRKPNIQIGCGACVELARGNAAKNVGEGHD